MIVDISFIPGDIIPQNLRESAERKIEYPYSVSSFEQKPKTNVQKNDRTSLFIINRKRFRENFRVFEDNLFNFARDMYRQRKYDIAEKSFRYLVEIGSLKAASKEYLLKIYIKQKNTGGIKWVKKRIQNQMSHPQSVASEKRKLKRIIGKYFSVS